MYEPLDSYLDTIDKQDAERDIWSLQCAITNLVQSAGLDMAIDAMQAMIAEAVAAEFQALEELPY